MVLQGDIGCCLAGKVEVAAAAKQDPVIDLPEIIIAFIKMEYAPEGNIHGFCNQYLATPGLYSYTR